MQPKGWKNLFFWILLTSSSVNWCCIKKVDAAKAANSDLGKGYGECEVATNWRLGTTETSIHSQVPQDVAPPTPPTLQPNPSNDPPQLEGQPTDFPKPSPTLIEQRLQAPEIDNAERLKRLLRRLQEKKETLQEPNSNGELGRLLVRERQIEQLPTPPLKPPPVAQSKPLGYLKARVGYFQTSNLFSSAVDPVEDGLIFSGLTLASAPLSLGSKTYLNGSIDGNLIRYVNQSKYNYNQIRFNLNIYQQLTPRIYGAIGWSNQQLFYARDSSNFDAGESFLNENSLYLSLGRRDTLTPRLMLDSLYELRLSFTDPPNNQNSRDRVSNSLLVSLNYYLQKSLQVGLDYQFNLSDFTQRQRQDQYHRLFGHLTYGISNYSNVSLQGGVSLGDSTARNIDFDGWFFIINYNFELGRF